MRSMGTLMLLLILMLTLAFITGCNGDDDDDDSSGGQPDDDDDNDDDNNDDDDTPVTTEGFVYIPPGIFTMGSPESEEGRRFNETAHDVTLTGDFEMMEAEVEQDLFTQIMDYNPSYFPLIGNDTYRPVEQVTWYDALAFANKLSAQHGYDECFVLTNIVCGDESTGDATDYCKGKGGIDSADVALNGISSVYECKGFRLPTEAEWEYAARAGTTTAFYNGDITNVACHPKDPNLDATAWYCYNAGYKSHAGRQKEPSSWGLYDIYGNVAEWTWDWYANEYPSDVTDPTGPESGFYKSVRGGSIRFDGALRCRSAYRAAYRPSYQSPYLGIRLVRSLFTKTNTFNNFSIDYKSGKPAEEKTKALPDELPFTFTRPDVGTPLTQTEIDEFTQKITGFWANVGYFDWILWTSHGMDGTNPYGYPDYKLYWQDTRAIKNGSVVTFEHYGGADNIMIRTPKVLNNAIAGYLMSGDAKLGEVVEQYCKGIVAMFLGMLWDEDDPELGIMPRAIFTTNHTFTQDGRQTVIDYDPAKNYKEDWNAHTIPNANNPTFGSMWVRNMRSKDDVPHIYRSVPMLKRLVQDAPDANIRAAGAGALEYLQMFAKDIVDSGFYIRTKDMYGNSIVPLNRDNGMVADLASLVMWEPLLPNAECTAKIASTLIGYDDTMELDCGSGINGIFEYVATLQHYFNWAIIRFFHVSAITNALIDGENDAAYTMLEGMAERVDDMMDGYGNWDDSSEFEADAAGFLLAAATGGLPLTSEEARFIRDQYSVSVDHYETFPYWDLWDASVPDGEIGYKPSRDCGTDCRVVRPEEMTFLMEYCYAPFRNDTGAQIVNCDIVLDPTRWGE